jgi:hypothetical protein
MGHRPELRPENKAHIERNVRRLRFASLCQRKAKSWPAADFGSVEPSKSGHRETLPDSPGFLGRSLADEVKEPRSAEKPRSEMEAGLFSNG